MKCFRNEVVVGKFRGHSLHWALCVVDFMAVRVRISGQSNTLETERRVSIETASYFRLIANDVDPRSAQVSSNYN